MANDRFGTEYEDQRKLLEATTFAGGLAGVLALKKVLGAEGPDRTHAEALETLRNVSLKFKETDKILEAAGIDPATTAAIPEAAARKAALVKFLRHLYMVGARGSQEVWVLSTPAAYRQYPSDELVDLRNNAGSFKTRLGDTKEQFDAGTRRKFGEATQMALAWAEAAKTVLANAKTDAAAMTKVKRWFASSSTPAATIEKTIQSVHAGFKKIANSLNGNRIVITDMPQQRGDPGQEYTEAFMLSIGAKSEMPRTIYIEQALFGNFDISVLHDMKKNWARVILHEVTHIDGRTEDKSYAHSGIGVGTDITADEAAVNADSWAFFAADCAGALTAGDIARCTGGTGGTLDKLPANWN